MRGSVAGVLLLSACAAGPDARPPSSPVGPSVDPCVASPGTTGCAQVIEPPRTVEVQREVSEPDREPEPNPPPILPIDRGGPQHGQGDAQRISDIAPTDRGRQ